MSNVISLNPDQPTYEREVSPHVIEGLEELLQMAKAGELAGFAVALQYYDRTSGFYARGKIGTYGMVGAMTMLQHTICETMRDGAE